MRLMIPLMMTLAFGACGDSTAPTDAPAEATAEKGKAGKAGKSGKGGKAGKAGKKKPAPTCPTSAELATALTEKLTSSTATCRPYRFCRPLTSITFTRHLPSTCPR